MSLEKRSRIGEKRLTNVLTESRDLSDEEVLLQDLSYKITHPRKWVRAYTSFWLNIIDPFSNYN